MVRVGVVGIGFMGMIHFLAYRRAKGAKVVAICSGDRKKRAGDWRGIQGNFGPPGEQMDLGGIATHASLDEMLADPKIDLIDVCLPPEMHEEATVRALKAGKHVFCEKPIALEVKAARKMVQAAERAKRLLFIGHVLPFFPEFAYALKLATSGKYGRVKSAHFRRVISEPTWLKGFFDPRRIGGPAVDLHVHDAHFLRVMLGMPKQLRSVGRMRGEVVEYFQTQFEYGDGGPFATATSGVIPQQGRPFTHGYEIHFERATLMFDFAVIGGEPEMAMPVTLLTARGKVQRPDLGEADPIDGFVAEINEVAKSIRRGKASELLGGDVARDALVLCHKQTQSVASGRVVRL